MFDLYMYVFTHIPIFIHKKWCKINILYVEGKDISDSLTDNSKQTLQKMELAVIYPGKYPLSI